MKIMKSAKNHGLYAWVMLSVSLFVLLGCSSVYRPGGAVVSALPKSGAAVKMCTPLAPVEGTVCKVIRGGDSLLIAGNVLTPDEVLVGGSVSVNPQGIIDYVGCTMPERNSSQTLILCPNGVISPGLINAHDHITYDQSYPSSWGSERYDHRHEWRLGLGGHTKVSYKAGTEQQIPWSELRQALSGTTSVAGSGGYRGLLRNLDKPDLLEGLKVDSAYYSVFPLGDSNGTINDCHSSKIDDPSVVLTHQCYLPHVGEGVNHAANNELHCMDVAKLMTPKSSFIHTVAALGKDGYLLKARGASVIWSPRSNISLYGNTAQVTMYKTLGLAISLGTDWTPSGSMNLLRELKCADSFNRNYLNGYFTDKNLWEMVTSNPADALKLSGSIGRLEKGLTADIVIYDGASRPNAYRAIIEADVDDVALVLRGGLPLYGETDIMMSIPGGQEGCESFPGGIKQRPKTVCVAREIGIDFTTLQKNNATSYPLFFASTPPGEPTCVPARVNEYTGQKTITDYDGDGIPNDKDSCPYVFNPIRPLDNGIQADCNNNGIGDPCDPAPCY